MQHPFVRNKIPDFAEVVGDLRIPILTNQIGLLYALSLHSGAHSIWAINFGESFVGKLCDFSDILSDSTFEDTEIHRVTYMTSFETNGIHIEIVAPHMRLFPTRGYPIPLHQIGVYTPIKLGVSIEHKNSNYFQLNPSQPFIPELVTSDGQRIQGYLVTEQLVNNTQASITIESNNIEQFDWWNIRPHCLTTFLLDAMLFWQNNSLQLRIPTLPHHWFSSVNNNSFWCFKGIEAKTYQLRLIINTNFENNILSNFRINQSVTAEENSSEMLATPWLKLRLVQPLTTDSNAIDVDGVLFKIETPESIVWTTPPKPNIVKSILKIVDKTYVELGIRVNNNTLTPLRFYQLGSIDVILRDEDGKEINAGRDPIRAGEGVRNQPRYYLIQPRNSTVFKVDIIISWYDGHIQIAIPNKSCNYFTGTEAFSYFSGLKLGVLYQLQFMYHAIEPREEWYLEQEVSEKVWGGCITMPPVEFRLAEQ